MPGSRTPDPFRDFHLGDTVRVNAHEDLRGGVSGVQRVYGIHLKVDTNGVETISSVTTSPL
jgi:hypothetical protein